MGLGYLYLFFYVFKNCPLVRYELAEDLSTPIPVGEYKENNDEYWLSKYLYCKKND